MQRHSYLIALAFRHQLSSNFSTFHLLSMPSLQLQK
nr:MAG TPA: hypothetical protein [Caudoviricetes sp.]